MTTSTNKTASKLLTTSTNNDRITEQQMLILYNLYLFRFMSTKQLQVILGKKQIQQVQQRLNLLLARGWIGKNFSKQDRLTGKYASYYLLPAGMKALKCYKHKLSDDPQLEPTILRNIYKDRTASVRFINHCLGLGDIYCHMYRRYEDRLSFFSKSTLTQDNYLPEQRPDAYVQLVTKDDASVRSEYLLEYCETIVPFWVYRKRIQYLIDYNDDKTWHEQTERPFPAILFVADTPQLERRLRRFLKRVVDNLWTDDMHFLTTSLERLSDTAVENKGIWVQVEPTD